MEGLDPYYNEYTGYEPGNTGNPETVEKNNKPDNRAEQIQTLGALSVFDSRRLSEVNLSESLASPYFPSSRAKTSEAPLVLYHPDTRRISIHPLGIIDRPAGVSEMSWSTMDHDGLFILPREIESHAFEHLSIVEEPGEMIKDEKHPVVRTSGNGGSDGGRTRAKEEGEDGLDPTEMPFLDHLEEFRWALLKSIFAVAIGMVSSWFLAKYFYATITKLANNAGLPLIYTKLMEPIMIQLQMAFFMGIVISLPFVFYFMWSFVSPGLYRREKKWILPVVIIATVCFFIGASIAYFLMIPLMLKFVKTFMVKDIKPFLTIGDFISKMLTFTVIFGIIFELPLITFILAKIGIIKHTWMSKYRRYAIVFIFIIAAIFTPPDPFSQIMMAIPLLFLYEISIIVARIAGRKTLI